jgi:predicted DNA-binding protein (MmcQ/YjbR family)
MVTVTKKCYLYRQIYTGGLLVTVTKKRNLYRQLRQNGDSHQVGGHPVGVTWESSVTDKPYPKKLLISLIR